MIRSFVKDGLIYSLSNIISRGISFLLIPIYTRKLSPADYGTVDLVLLTCTLVSIIITLEVSQGTVRYIGEASTKEQKVHYVSSAFWFTLFVYLLFTVIAWLLPSNMLTWFVGERASLELLPIIITTIASYGVLLSLQNQLRWSMKSRDYAVSSFINSLVIIASTVYFLEFENAGIEGALKGLSIGFTSTIMVALYYNREYIKLTINWSKLKTLLLFSYPLVPSSIGVFLSLYIDRLIIKEMLTMADLGVYGIAYRFASITGIFIMSFSSAITPLIYSHHHERETPEKIAHIFQMFIIGTLAIELFLSLFSHQLLQLFTTPDYYRAGVLIPFLVMTIIVSNIYVFFPGLSIAKKTKVIAVINILPAGVNTGLNILLLPLLGINGVAIATLLSAVIACYLNVSYGQREYYIPIIWSKVFACFICAILFIILGSFMNASNLWIAICIKMIVLVSGCSVITVILFGRQRVVTLLQHYTELFGKILR